MLRYILFLLIFSTSIVVMPCRCMGAHATPSRTELQRLSNTSLPVLFEKAQGYYESHPDSAVIYYSAIINRYSPSMTDQEKEICIKSALDKWELVFFLYFDYSTAFESLLRAKEIDYDMSRYGPRIDLYYGCMYHTVFEQSDDLETGQKAFDYFCKSFDGAIKGKDVKVSRMAFGNMCEVAGSLNCLNDIKERVELYKKISDGEKWNGREFDLGLYRAECLEAAGDYANSADAYQHLVEMARKPGWERYRYAVLQGLISSRILNGEIKEALSLIERVDTIADAEDLRDGRLMLYNMRAVCYDSLGNYELARKSRYDFIMLKDSLLNYNQAAAIKSVEFMDEIREFDRRLSESRQKRQRQMAILIGVVAMLVVVGVAWWKLRLKNKDLESANKSLYRKNQELLHLEEDALRIRDAVSNNKDDITDCDSAEKYKGTIVTDDMRKLLWEAIMDVLDHSSEIYDPDFSLERLAELCGSKSKYVSQVINEKGDNFKTLINTRRIHKACRIMTETCNLTIEAISNEVGFRSTNAFRTSFKRVTGLSPSKYLQMAKQQSVDDTVQE